MRSRRALSIAVIAFCQVAAMALRFSASAVGSGLRAEGVLDSQTASLITSAVQVGFVGGNPALLVALCLIWGVSLVADSPQFSASIVELSDRSMVGTKLTVQTSMDFLLTLPTIHLVPPVVEAVTWLYAFALLAHGPLVGVVAMWRLRVHPNAVKLANGNR